MSKALLITGATGKQGGAVVDALIAHPSAADFTILAVTRDVSSASAQRLQAKSDRIKLVKGDLDAVPALFQAAKEANAGSPIWGVYSVQISMGKGVTLESEVKQGSDMIDEAVKQGVKQFVYSSVERGGDEASWDNTTPIPRTSTSIVLCPRHSTDKAARQTSRANTTLSTTSRTMPATWAGPSSAPWPSWTTSSPDSPPRYVPRTSIPLPHPNRTMTTDSAVQVFMAALRDTMKGKSVQWVATHDIGQFAAMAFAKPDEFRHKAIGLAGEELNVDGLARAFKNTTGSDAIATFGFLGSVLRYMVTELAVMMDWFKSDGYKADIAKLKQMHPKLMDFETWIKQESKFTTSK